MTTLMCCVLRVQRVDRAEVRVLGMCQDLWARFRCDRLLLMRDGRLITSAADRVRRSLRRRCDDRDPAFTAAYLARIDVWFT
jgi:ABC-type hemin transport system ATPase subunit